MFLLVDWYAYQSFKTAFLGFSDHSQKTLKVIYIGLIIISLACFFYYHFGNPDLLGKHTRTFLLSIVFMHYLAKVILVLFAFIDDIQRGMRWLVFKLSNPEPNENQEGISRSEFLAKTGIVVAAAPIISLSWGIISGAHDYRVRRVSIPIKGLPKALDGIKIAQVSDIHSGSFWNKTAVKGGVEMLLNEKPDIAMFTGDLVNNKATEMSDWGSVFSKIKAPLGTYSVFGNHDYGDYVQWESPEAKHKNLADLAAIHKNMGWDLLINENRILEIDGEKLAILGIENWGAKARFPKYGKMGEAIKGLPDEMTQVLLSHDPSHWQAEVLTQYQNVNLTLAGHTHGMQFGIDIPGFKWSPVQYMYEEWAGLYQSNNQYLYVNRGYGYLGYPGRVGILPEISILTLESV
jgi:predicted MPP superfamily phosphohydrolase